MSKERFDYTQLKLAKVDGLVSFNGHKVDDLPATSLKFLANYGAFVNMTRELAGHEKDTLDEKQALLDAQWSWLEAGCPKRERATVDIQARTIATMRAAVANGTPAEKKQIEGIIAKMLTK